MEFGYTTDLYGFLIEGILGFGVCVGLDIWLVADLFNFAFLGLDFGVLGLWVLNFGVWL